MAEILGGYGQALTLAGRGEESRPYLDEALNLSRELKNEGLVAQTLAGHHSASFTLDQYADAVPEQLEEAGEKVASVLVAASGSKTVAAPKLLDSERA